MDSVIKSGETVQAAPVQKRGISGSTIKLIAITAMLIDHIGAVIIERMLINAGMLTVMQSGNANALLQFYAENGGLFALYMIMRQLIGRIGFPIFCFLLVEGFAHTRNVAKYASRLFLFALVSEIPFDLALTGRPFFWGYQNVFFTLFIGLLVMIAYRWIEKRKINRIAKAFLYVAALAVGIIAAMLVKSDYGSQYGIGVICIMALYIFRKNKMHQIIAGCVSFLWELTAPLAFIPVGFYNGKRGFRLKYVFYAFYPAHLFLLYLAARFLGLL